MAFSVRKAGLWAAVTAWSVRQGGTWKTVQKAHVRKDGAWKEFYTTSAPPPPPPPPPPPAPISITGLGSVSISYQGTGPEYQGTFSRTVTASGGVPPYTYSFGYGAEGGAFITFQYESGQTAVWYYVVEPYGPLTSSLYDTINVTVTDSVGNTGFRQSTVRQVG